MTDDHEGVSANWFIDFSCNDYRRPVIGQSYSDWVLINLNFTCYFPFLEPEVDVQIVSVTSPTSQSILVKWQVNIRFIFTKPISMLLQRLSPSRYWGVRIFPSPSPPHPPFDASIISDPKTHKWRLHVYDSDFLIVDRNTCVTTASTV